MLPRRICAVTPPSPYALGAPAPSSGGRVHQPGRHCRHLLSLLRRLAKVSGEARPEGRQPACAWGDVAWRRNPSRRVREAGWLPPPARRTGRERFPSSSSSISKAVSRTRQPSYHRLAVRYCTAVEALAGKGAPVEQCHRPLPHLLSRFRCGSRTETPPGSQLACAPGHVATRIRPTPGRPSLFPTPIPAPPSGGLTAFFPFVHRSATGLPRSVRLTRMGEVRSVRR